MEKSELMALAKKYNMDFIRENITQEGVGVWCKSADLIPELDALCAAQDGDYTQSNVIGTRELFQPGGDYMYKIYCPKEWITLWGWK